MMAIQPDLFTPAGDVAVIGPHQIALDPMIVEAVSNGAVVVFNLSGGKDCGAAAALTIAWLDSVGHPKHLRLAIHADLGRAEWEFTPDHAVAQVALAPHITKFRTGSVGSDMADPMPTVTANGEPAKPAGATPLGIVGCTMVQTGHGEREGQAPRALDIGKPLGTVVAGANNFAAVEAAMAPIIDRQFGRSAADSVEDPLATTSTKNKSAMVSAFLSRFHKSNTNGGSGDPERPLGAVTAGGMHHAVVGAHMAQFNNNPDGSVNAGHDMRKTVSTVSTKGPTQAVVHTTMIEEGSLPPEMMAKATRVAAFLVKYYGSAIGQAVDKPFDTVTTLPRYAVVTVTIDAVTYVIVDIGMRMLTPRELARAQGFPDSYILDPITPQLIRGKIVHKPLTIAAQIRMIGNSVCPDVAHALVAANQPGIEMRMAA